MATDKIEVIEGNKLIAEFMSYDYSMYKKWIDDEDAKKDRQIEVPLDEEDLEYHTSWDWLMHVYWKIGSINELSRYPNLRMMRDKHPLFHTVQQFWEQAIDFIKWYNQHSKPQTI